MSTEQAGKPTTEPQALTGPGPSQIEPEGAGLMTPWLRRRFGLGPAAGQRAGVATERIRTLLARIRSAGEWTRVWKPDIGSLRPELVQRFSSAIARRHERLQLVSVRRKLAAPTDPWRDALELTLPTGARPAEPGTSATAGMRRGPSIFSVGQPIPRLSSQIPSAGRPASQSRGPSRPSGQPQRREPPARSRLFSRVEEVTSPGHEPPMGQEEPVPRMPELDLEPQEPAVDTPPQDAEPGVEGEQPSPRGTESTPQQGLPTIQRRAADALSPAPPQRQERPARSQPLPAERTPAPPVRQLGEPQWPTAETTAGPDAPEPEAMEGHEADELPLRPPPTPPAATPSRPHVMHEPSPRQTDAAPPSPSDSQRGWDEPATAPPRRQPSTSRPEEAPLSGPPPTSTPPITAEGSPARPEAARPDAKPPAPAEAGQPQAPRRAPSVVPQPDKPDDPAVDSTGVATEREASAERGVRRAAVAPDAVERRPDEPEPEAQSVRPRGAPDLQRQVREAADRQTPPALSEGGRWILARARSRARVTLTKLVPERHPPPEAGPVPAGAAETLSWAPEPQPSPLTRIHRRRRHHRGSPTLYGRGPEVHIGPDSSLPVTRRIAGARPHRESGPGKPRERPDPAIPLEVRSLLSAMEGRAEGGVRGEGLPLPRLPSPSAPRGTSIQRATGGTPARQGPPGGGSEPPWLPPPPPEEPSLPLARPPAPRPIGEQATEQIAGTQGVVQRAPDGAVGTLQREPDVVQRAPGDEEYWEEIDLPKLARRVYPVIKRMLSIERERTRGRSL